MGNSESMPRALHDNFLAVSASIKARLGPDAAAAALQGSAAGRGGDLAFNYSFEQASGDDSDDRSLRKNASRRKQSDTRTRGSNTRSGGGAASFSSLSPSPAARRSPAARNSIPRRAAGPQQQEGPVNAARRKDSGVAAAAYSRGKGGAGGGGGGVEADEAFPYNSYDSTGSNTPAAAERVPQMKQAVPEGQQQQQHTSGSSSSSGENRSGSGSSRRQPQEGSGRSSRKQESNTRHARGSRRSEERSSTSAEVKSGHSDSRRGSAAGAEEYGNGGDVHKRPSLAWDTTAAREKDAGGVSKNEKDASLDWDAALDFAEEEGDGGVDEERRRQGLCTRASSVKAASPRLFPSSPTADSWPAAVASPAAAVSPSATSVASSRPVSPQKQQHRAAAAAGLGPQKGSWHTVAEKGRLQQQRGGGSIDHLGSSRSAARSSSSSKGLDECRLSDTGPAEKCRNGRHAAAGVGEGGSYVKGGRADDRHETATEVEDLACLAAQAETQSETAADSSSSTTCSLRRRTATEQSMTAAGSSSNSSSKEGTDAAAPAERWPAAASLEQSPSAGGGRAHHHSAAAAASASEGMNAGGRTQGAASEGSGCFSFNSSFEKDKTRRKMPLLLQQQEEEETGLSLLSPSYHLDAACTRSATPTTDATTVGSSSSSSAEESWGAGRSSRAEAGRGGKAPDGRQSPRRIHGDSSNHAAAAAGAKIAAAADADGPAAGGARSIGVSDGATAATAARGRRVPGTERSRSKKRIIYGHPQNDFPFLQEPALSHLLPFLFDRSLAACMTVCPHWFMKINSCIERMCSPINKRFAAAYGEYLQLWGAAVKLQPLQTADRDGVRIDWIIFAKVLPAAAGKFVHFGYTYSYAPTPARRLSTLELVRRINSSSSNATDPSSNSTSRSSSSSRSNASPAADFPHREGLILSPDGQPCPSMSPRRVYAVAYCLAAGNAGSSRALWIHRDNCRFHGDETGVAAMSSVSPVCVGDFVEVAVSLASGEGRVAAETVEWLPLRQETRRESNPARRIFTRETCPLELTFSEWFDADTFRHLGTEKVREPENFGPRLRHEKTLYSGFDVAIRKSTYRAVAPGPLGGTACRQWGFPCEILPAGVPVVCPLIRRGLQHDRFLSVQMRVGDVVDYYVSQGGTNT